ncbi:MAG: hypothetical protein HKN70_08755 [Gammaproteobacteria bacterium]|nr:hypothetical protein [Gammaproteobacteria bacterium]
MLTLKAALQVGVGGFLSVFAINAILVFISAAWPNWLPRQFMGVDFLADNRQRAEAVTALYQHGQLQRTDRFVSILGLSSASEGISLEALTSRIDDGTRFLGLSGGGRNMRDVARYAQPLLAGDARPVLVVFALNPFHLMDTPPVTEAFMDNLRKSEIADDLRGYWMVNRRQDVKYAMDAAIDRSRSGLFKIFAVHLGGGGDPWREIMRMGLAPATTETQWQSNVQRYGERGYYELQNYTRSQTQIGILYDLVRRFQQRGSDMMLVWMPEHSRLRAEIPNAAVSKITQGLKDLLDSRMAQVIDRRSAITDSGFNDISHMNLTGRERFSHILAEDIKHQLSRQGTDKRGSSGMPLR